jgi:hypothetical protein
MSPCRSDDNLAPYGACILARLLSSARQWWPQKLFPGFPTEESPRHIHPSPMSGIHPCPAAAVFAGEKSPHASDRKGCKIFPSLPFHSGPISTLFRYSRPEIHQRFRCRRLH